MNLFEEMTENEVQAFYDDGIVINKITMEDVMAYRLPPDKPINISDAPKWVQDFACWDKGQEQELAVFNPVEFEKHYYL